MRSAATFSNVEHNGEVLRGGRHWGVAERSTRRYAAGIDANAHDCEKCAIQSAFGRTA